MKYKEVDEIQRSGWNTKKWMEYKEKTKKWIEYKEKTKKWIEYKEKTKGG